MKDIENINKIGIERKKKLEEVKNKLKEHFVGIDKQIDELIEGIELWYCFPDYCIKPTIINLWGLPGTGKTDLVNKLVLLLEMSENFCSVNLSENTYKSGMATGDFRDYSRFKNTYGPSIFNDMARENVCIGRHGVLLIDEFHTFSNYAKKHTNSDYYTDIWQLLSDGRLYSHSQVEKWLNNLRFNIESRYDKAIEHGTKTMVETYEMSQNNPNPMSMNHGNSNNMNYENFFKAYSGKIEKDEAYIFTSLFELTDDERKFLIKEIKNYKMIRNMNSPMMMFSNSVLDSDLDEYDDISLLSMSPYFAQRKIIDDYYHKLKNMKETSSIYELNRSFTYSKLLIFINGNILDKGDVNITEEVVRKHIYDLFRPEQVSRLGSRYITFDKFNKNDYVEVRKRVISNYIKDIYKEYGVKIEITEDDIEKEYPIDAYLADGNTRGMREVYDDINNFMASKIPNILLDNLKGI